MNKTLAITIPKRDALTEEEKKKLELEITGYSSTLFCYNNRLVHLLDVVNHAKQWAPLVMYPVGAYLAKKTIDVAADIAKTSYFAWFSERKTQERTVKILGPDGNVVQVINYKVDTKGKYVK